MSEDEAREALAANANLAAHWQRAIDARETETGVTDYFGRRQLWRIERHRDELEHALAKAIYQ